MGAGHPVSGEPCTCDATWVERCFNRLKHVPGLTTRYDKIV